MGSTVTYTYGYGTDGNYPKTEALNEPTTVKDPLGHLTHYQWDGRGNLTSVADALGNQTQFQYNEADQLTKVTYPLTVAGGTNAYTLTTYLYPGGPVTRVQIFDETGAQVREVDRTGGNEDELIKLTGSVPTVQNIYDPLYRGSQIKDGNANSSTQSFDSVGNPNLFTLPGFNSTTYFDSVRTTSFDPDGNPLTSFDGRNAETDLSYADPESLLTNVNYNNQGQASLNVSYVYDGYGRVSQRTDGVSEEVYAYDDLDLVQSVTTTYLSATGTALFTKEISYTYNNDGSRATMSTPAGGFAYFREDAGRVTEVDFPWAKIGYGYYDNNWLASQGVPIGADQSALVTSQYTYNARGQLRTLTNNPINSTNFLSSFSGLTYDGVGNRLSMNVQIPAVVGVTSLAAGVSGNIIWTYDNQDHLTLENNQMVSAGAGNNSYAVPYSNSFVADADENLTTFRGKAVAYNADNQLVGVTYDGDGNPTAYVVPADGSTRATTFDPEDRMTLLSGFINASYFADGRRSRKYTTYFLYDGNTLLCELDVNGNVLTTYGFGAAGLIQRYVPGTNVTYAYTFDPGGNLVQRSSTTNVANGVPADFTTYYDAFGAQLHQIDVNSGSTFESPDAVGFGGQWGYYTENGTSPPAGVGKAPVVRYPFCLLGVRYYDPSVGRFLTRDPAGYEGGINLYAFTGNNPINRADPSGLWSWDDGIKFGLDLGAGIAGDAIAPGIGGSVAVGVTDCLLAHFHDHKEWNESIQTGLINGITSHLGGALLNKGIGLVGKILQSGPVQAFLRRFGCEGEGFIAGLLRKIGAKVGVYCFVAGTPVQVAADDPLSVMQARLDDPLQLNVLSTTPVVTKPIERVAVGDRVVSRDPQTGKTALKRVQARSVKTAPMVVSLALGATVNGPTLETLTTTLAAYVEGKDFVPAGQLGIGNAIVTRAGPALVVQKVERQFRPDGYTVYNLTVEDDHSYFVGNADGGVWVHNTDCTEFEVGNYDGLKSRAAGTGLEIHHVPQAHLGEQAISGYSRESGLAIALRSSVHRGLPATSRLRGALSGLTNSSVRALISQQLRDLSNAGVPTPALRLLGQALRNSYPSVFER